MAWKEHKGKVSFAQDKKEIKEAGNRYIDEVREQEEVNHPKLIPCLASDSSSKKAIAIGAYG